MNSVDRVLLDRIQRFFPLVPRPYRVLSEDLDVDEKGVRDHIRALKEQNLVRQISAIFNTGALGYRSSLVAMAVDEDHIEAAAEVINSYPGVSHNYLRPGSYNLWYTIAVPPWKSMKATVEELAARAGGWSTLILPAIRKYKLAVVLEVLEEGEGDAPEERNESPLLEATASFKPTAQNIRIVRCIQEDLPLVERPFAAWGESLGMSEEGLLELMAGWVSQGIIRRFAAVLNHRRVGFRGNGMVVWSCPEDLIDRYGTILSSYPEVSHCYHRPAYPEWPYNLYAMVHGRTEDECHKIARKLGEAVNLRDYRISFSTREFKKVRLKLFVE